MFRLGAYLSLLGGLIYLGVAGVRSEPAEVKEPKAEAAKDHLGDPLPAAAKLRLGTIRFRHGGTVTSVRYLPDGKTLMSYGNDQSLRYWDAVSGKELHSVNTAFTPNNNANMFQEINNIQIRLQLAMAMQAGRGAGNWCLSPNGLLLATMDGVNLSIRDLMADKIIRHIKLDEMAQSIVFSPDSSRLGAIVARSTENGAAETLIKLFEVATGKELRTLVAKPDQEGQQPFMPYTVIFSPDNKLLVGLGTEFNNNTNNRLRIWDLTGNKEPHRLLEHSGSAVVPVFSPNGQMLAEVSVNPVTGGNAKLRLWDAVTGKQIREVGDMANGASLIVFSPDGKVVAAVEAANQGIHLYETATAKEITTLAATSNPPTVVFAPDSRTVAVAGNDQVVHIFEVSSGKETQQIKGYVFTGQNLDAQGLGCAVSYSADGKTVAITAGTVIRRWSVATGKEVPLPGAGHETAVASVAISSDGKMIATAGTDGLLVWDAAAGTVARRLPLQPAKRDPPADDEAPGVGSVAFTPDGKTLAAGEADGSIRLYDPATGKELRRISSPGGENGHDGEVTGLAFTAGGKLLISAAYDGRILAWDVATGKQVRQFVGPVAGAEMIQGRSGVAFSLSPDGATLIAATDDGTRLYEVATAKPRRQLSRTAAAANAVPEIRSVAGSFVAGAAAAGDDRPAFSPDGRTAATISDSTVTLWDTARGKELRQFGGQGSSVHSVAFAPGGKVIAASSEDGSIRFWDVANGTVLSQVEGHRGGVGTIAFSTDGQTLVSAGNDTTVLIWDVPLCLRGGSKSAKPTAQTALRLWDRLVEDDAADAMADLIDNPDVAVPLLRDKLQTVPPADKVRLAKLVAHLEDGSFEVRKRANEELERLAELAEPALQAVLKDGPSLEVKQRIDRLLEKIHGPVAIPTQVRALRAMEVLGKIGTPAARAVLEKMAQGTADSRVTERAKAWLEYVDKNGGGGQ